MTNNINSNNKSSSFWQKRVSSLQSFGNRTPTAAQKHEEKDTFESSNKKNNNRKTLTISLIVGSILAIAGAAIWFNKNKDKDGETKPPSPPPPPKASIQDIEKIKEVEDEIARLTKLNEQTKTIIEIITSNRFDAGLYALNNIKGLGRLSGYSKEKKILIDNICRPIANEKYNTQPQQVPAGVLLYGPMGTGKTILPKAIATQTDCHYIAIIHENSPEKTFKKIEEEALEAQTRFKEEGKRTIIQLDEVEVLARHKNMAEKLNRFMDTSSEELHCTLIGTTNHPDRIDDSFLAHNKLFKMPIPPADKESAAEIIKRYSEIAETVGKIKYDEIAEHVVRHQPEKAFSNDLIKETVVKVVVKAIRHEGEVSHDTLLEAFKATAPDISKEALDLFAKNIKKLK